MPLVVKVGFIVVLLLAAWRAARVFQTGRIKIFDTDGPALVIARQDRPLAYWSFIVFFYAVLTLMALSVAAA
jgi:hypothetical protein